MQEDTQLLGTCFSAALLGTLSQAQLLEGLDEDDVSFVAVHRMSQVGCQEWAFLRVPLPSHPHFIPCGCRQSQTYCRRISSYSLCGTTQVMRW